MNSSEFQEQIRTVHNPYGKESAETREELPGNYTAALGHGPGSTNNIFKPFVE